MTPMDVSSTGGPSPDNSSTNSPIVATSTPREQITLPPAPGPTGYAPAPTSGTSSSLPFSPGGSITLDPTTTPSSTLNPRSCVTCRRRKVRCDKFMPCGNCRKAHIQCVFPAPGRAPRRPRIKDPNAPPKQSSEREIELMKRLRKLEGIVEDLSGQIEFEGGKNPSSNGGSPEATVDGINNNNNNNNGGGSNTNAPDRERRRMNNGFFVTGNTPIGNSPNDSPLRTTKPMSPGDPSPGSLLRSPTGEAQKELGRLVLNEKGKSRYISNAFWTKLNDEITELRAETQKLTDDESEESEEEVFEAPVHHSYFEHGDHHGFVLGYKSSEVDLSTLHPLPSQVPFIWQVYVENVDPLVKILHVPTMNKLIRDCRNNMKNLSPGLEALLFSIYYASITSMEDEEVKMNFNTEKSTLINQFRFATEQALAKADFLTCSELVVAQAFTLFLILVRRYDDTRFSWTLTGLAIRIGQSLGLHREGTHFAELKPFDVEMRRRLWWTMCLLDLRSAEDQGTELTISERTYDTRLPLNVNDTDLSPDMTEFPDERQGATDMTFSLVRFEVCSFARRMHMATSTIGPCPFGLQSTAKEKEEALIEVYDRVDEKYFQGSMSKDTNPLHWTASLIARLIMAKLSLVIYQPFYLERAGEELSQKVRDRLFTSCIEVVEYNKLLNGEPKCRQWRWLFQTYTQWHSVAYLLLEICRRPWTPAVERAWMALTNTFRDTEPSEHAKLVAHSAAWVPLRKLMIKAERHREAEIARLRDDSQAAEQLDVDEVNRMAPSSFQHLSSSVRTTVAHDRWRTLVGRESFNKPKRGRVEDTNFGLLRGQGSGAPQQQKMNNQQLQQLQQQQQQQSQLQRQQGQGQRDPRLDYLDHTMQQPTFNPEDFFSAAFPGGLDGSSSNEIAQRVFFSATAMGQGQGQGPEQASSSAQAQTHAQQVNNIPNGNFRPPTSDPYNNNSNNNANTNINNNTGPPSNVSGDPTTLRDDHLPPWLWPGQWNASSTTNTTNSTNNNTNNANANSTSSTAGNTPVVNDIDINMDEDINWQNWQESIRGFEMDTGLGIGRAGFMGGF